MTPTEAALLGIVQGATEFLPISSSGHLLLVPAVLGLTEPSLNVIAIAHLGTLLAVLVYFFRDILAIARAALTGLVRGRPFDDADARLGWFIVAGCVPAAVLGLSFADTIDDTLGTPTLAAVFLLVTAALLVIGELLRSGKIGLDRLGFSQAMLIGCAQALALLPGISRSGSTIVAGLSCGLSREAAARYSFLLGAPVIFGAGMLALKDMLDDASFGDQHTALAITFVTSALSGYLCIHWLLRWLRRRSLLPFAVYCALFGAGFLLFGR